MSKVNTVDLLVTDWGEFDCPPDFVKLRDAAPKTIIKYVNEDGDRVKREIVDQTTSKGSAYYAREREILNAIGVIYSTATMVVVNTKER